MKIKLRSNLSSQGYLLKSSVCDYYTETARRYSNINFVKEKQKAFNTRKTTIKWK